MGFTLVLIVLMAIAAVAIFVSRAKAADRRLRFEDAQAEARHWVDRLGGQIVQILGRDDASKQRSARRARRDLGAWFGGRVRRALRRDGRRPGNRGLAGSENRVTTGVSGWSAAKC